MSGEARDCSALVVVTSLIEISPYCGAVAPAVRKRVGEIKSEGKAVSGGGRI